MYTIFENLPNDITEMQISQRLGTFDTKHISEEDKFFLDAEKIAFGFNEVSSFYNWGMNVKKSIFHPMWKPKDEQGKEICLPNASQITKEIMNYWAQRIYKVKTPILKARYAGLVWDFYKLFPASDYDTRLKIADIGKLRINSTLEYIESADDKDYYRLNPKIKHILHIASKLNDYERLKKIIALVLSKNIFLSPDALPETYDLLFCKKNIGLTESQRTSFLEKLESALSLISKTSRMNLIEIGIAQKIASRLASYYHSHDQLDKKAAALERYFNLVLESCQKLPILQAYILIKEAIEIAKKYGQKEAKNKLFTMVEEISRKPLEEIKIFCFPAKPISIDQKDIDYFIEGTLEQSLEKFRELFIPKKSFIIQIYEENKNCYPISSQATKIHMNASKIPEAIDSNGNIVYEATNLIKILLPRMRLIIIEIFKLHAVDNSTLLEYFKDTYFLRPEIKEIFSSGLNAYLHNEPIIAISILIPLIEGSLRYILKTQSISTLGKTNKNSGYDAKLLNDLLLEPFIGDILGEDDQFYLSVVLTERIVFNLRNNFSHGLMNTSDFNMSNADLIFMIFLILRKIMILVSNNKIKDNLPSL